MTLTKTMKEELLQGICPYCGEFFTEEQIEKVGKRIQTCGSDNCQKEHERTRNKNKDEYNEQIDVAMAVHLAASGGPEEDDLLRLRHLYNAPNDVVQRLLVKHPLVHGLSPTSARRACSALTVCGQFPPPKSPRLANRLLRKLIKISRHCLEIFAGF